jgi:hypothetical protein
VDLNELTLANIFMNKLSYMLVKLKPKSVNVERKPYKRNKYEYHVELVLI